LARRRASSEPAPCAGTDRPPACLPASSPCLPVCRCILPAFTDQGLANLLWAFATTGLHDAELGAAVAAEAQGRLRAFRPQNLSLLAWALAKGRHDGSTCGFWDSLALVVEQRAWAMRTHELAMALWALASADPLGGAARQAFRSAAPVLLQKLREPPEPAGAQGAGQRRGGQPGGSRQPGGGGQPGGGRDKQQQDLGNLAWAYARAELHDAQLLGLLLQLAQRHMASGPGLGLSALCQLLSACGTLGHYDPDFLEAACLQLQRPEVLAGMGHQSLGTACPALAKLNHRDGATWRALAGAMAALAGEGSSWSSYSLSACLWSCAVVGWEEASTFEALFGALARHRVAAFDDVCLGQCFQAYLYAQVRSAAPQQARLWRLRRRARRARDLRRRPHRPTPTAAARRRARGRAWRARSSASRPPCWRRAAATGARAWRPPAACLTSSCRSRAACAPWG
jgi:hypothetical protein